MKTTDVIKCIGLNRPQEYSETEPMQARVGNAEVFQDNATSNEEDGANEEEEGLSNENTLGKEYENTDKSESEDNVPEVHQIADTEMYNEETENNTLAMLKDQKP
eukprot:7823994-Ditylum_brightwellii.AAC.1